MTPAKFARLSWMSACARTERYAYGVTKFATTSRARLLESPKFRYFWRHDRHIFMASAPWRGDGSVGKEATTAVTIRKGEPIEIVTKERYKRDAYSKKTGEFHKKGDLKHKMVPPPLSGRLYDECCRHWIDRTTIALGESPLTVDEFEEKITYGQDRKLIAFALDVDELPTDSAQKMLDDFISRIKMVPSTALIHEKRGYSTLQVKWILEKEFWADRVKEMGKRVGQVWDALNPSYPCDKEFRGFIAKNHWFFKYNPNADGERYRFFEYGKFVSEDDYGSFVGKFFSIHENPYMNADMRYDCMAENLWDGDRELEKLMAGRKAMEERSPSQKPERKKANLKGNAEKAENDLKGRNSYVFRLRAEKFVEFYEKNRYIKHEDYRDIIKNLYEESVQKTPNGKKYGMPSEEQIEAEAKYCSKKSIHEWASIVSRKKMKAEKGLIVRKLIRFLKAYSLGFLSMNGTRIMPDFETVSMIESSYRYAFKKMDSKMLLSILETEPEKIDDLEILSLLLCRRGKLSSSVHRSKQKKAFSGNWMEEIRKCVEDLKDGIVDGNPLIKTVETVLNVILFGKEVAKTKGWGYKAEEYDYEDEEDDGINLTVEEMYEELCRRYPPWKARRILGIPPPPKVVK